MSKIQWANTSAYARQYFQPKCVEIMLKQFFDPDLRVIKATQQFLPLLVANVEFGQETNAFKAKIPQWFNAEESGFKHIPMVIQDFKSQLRDFIITWIFNNNFKNFFGFNTKIFFLFCIVNNKNLDLNS